MPTGSWTPRTLARSTPPETHYRARWEQANIPAILLLVAFILVIVLLDVILPGLVPKWVIFAPVFIPIFASMDVAPQTRHTGWVTHP